VGETGAAELIDVGTSGTEPMAGTVLCGWAAGRVGELPAVFDQTMIPMLDSSIAPSSTAHTVPALTSRDGPSSSRSGAGSVLPRSIT
jgi:hypothetical protein